MKQSTLQTIQTFTIGAIVTCLLLVYLTMDNIVETNRVLLKRTDDLTITNQNLIEAGNNLLRRIEKLEATSGRSNKN